jgi:hypothetical protein
VTVEIAQSRGMTPAIRWSTAGLCRITAMQVLVSSK